MKEKNICGITGVPYLYETRTLDEIREMLHINMEDDLIYLKSSIHDFMNKLKNGDFDLEYNNYNYSKESNIEQKLDYSIFNLIKDDLFIIRNKLTKANGIRSCKERNEIFAVEEQKYLNDICFKSFGANFIIVSSLYDKNSENKVVVSNFNLLNKVGIENLILAKTNFDFEELVKKYDLSTALFCSEPYDIIDNYYTFVLYKKINIIERLKKLKCFVVEKIQEVLSKNDIVEMSEFSPIILYKTSTNSYGLINGLRRLLSKKIDKIDDIKIPIRIYDEFNEINFLKLVMTTNYWKFSTFGHINGYGNKYSSFYFGDSSFLYAIEKRYETKINTNTRIFIPALIDTYYPQDSFNPNNSFFISDIISLLSLTNLNELELLCGHLLFDKLCRKIGRTLFKLRTYCIENNITCLKINLKQIVDDTFSQKTLHKSLKKQSTLITESCVDDYIYKTISPILFDTLANAIIPNVDKIELPEKLRY